MVDEGPKRAEQPTWNEAEWGPLAFRVFKECPHCGCPSRFAVEALRGEMPEEAMKKKPPAIGSFEFIYDADRFRITLTAIVDSCCKCGTMYTVARSKRKSPLILAPKGRNLPPLIIGR